MLFGKAKPDYILHTHSENAVAISCLKNGFNTKLNQSSMRFYNAIKYFDYNDQIKKFTISKNNVQKFVFQCKTKTRSMASLFLLRNSFITEMGSC